MHKEIKEVSFEDRDSDSRSDYSASFKVVTPSTNRVREELIEPPSPLKLHRIIDEVEESER